VERCSPRVIRDPVPAPRPPTPAQRLARAVLALLGWRAVLAWPIVPKGVVAVYPHTSNWDFFIGLLWRFATGFPVRFIGKDTIFRWPVRGLLERLGGTPVNRRESTGLVGQLAAEFERRPWIWLAVAPEGTRGRTDHWKSGFYRLALAAKVPVGLGFIDYGARELGVSTYLDLSGDEEADLARMRAFYAGKVGRHPAQAGEIRFRPDHRQG
jgi:1-acyl-sn-glycerol-3-phosphate acyltransferase